MNSTQLITFLEALNEASRKHLETAENHVKEPNSDIYVSNMTTVFVLNAIGGALGKALSSQ